MKMKSLYEHKNYLYEIVRLKLWFLWNWQRKHENEPFRETIRNRVDIFRKTDMNSGTMNPPSADFDNPIWEEIEDQLHRIYWKHKGENSALPFESEAFSILKPRIDGRANRDYMEKPYVEDYNSGSLHYEKPERDHPERVFFHIANSIAPRSIFEDESHIPQCLIELMDKSASEFNATSLCTESWLNSHPRWISLFPEDWRKNMSAENRDIQWHYGFWGQFITKRGTFNSRLGSSLRETGQFPYLPRYSWCDFTSLRNHLSSFCSF